MTADVPKTLLNYAHEVYIISDVKTGHCFVLFHLSVTKRPPRRGVQGRRWIDGGSTGTRTTHGGARAQVNPGNNKLRDLTRRDSHVKHQAVPYSSRGVEPSPRGGSCAAGPHTHTGARRSPAHGAAGKHRPQERCPGNTQTPSLTARSQLSSNKQKKISALGPFSATPTARTDLAAQLWSWGQSGASIFLVPLGAAPHLLHLI